MPHARTLAMIFGIGCAATAAFAQANDQPARPKFQEDGTVGVPAFELPVSVFMSEEAKAIQRMKAQDPGIRSSVMPRDIQATRTFMDARLEPAVKAALGSYAVRVEEGSVAGIPVRVVTPADGKFDPKRVLINLHGGAFAHCWGACSLIESAPIAALGGYKVVSVNYRMAPEYRHPAALEDATKVYAELIKQFQPKHIGIFGCSAGGALTAQLAAWLPAHKLPQAGAVGIFGAGGVRFRGGDSAYLSASVDGQLPAPAKDGTQPRDITFGYFDNSDMSARDVSPALYLDELRKYPPTLLITGTRAFDMSPAIFTNSQLIKAGVETDLIVADGMNHCYIMTPSLPEAKDAYAAIVGFFKKHLN